MAPVFTQARCCPELSVLECLKSLGSLKQYFPKAVWETMDGLKSGEEDGFG